MRYSLQLAMCDSETKVTEAQYNAYGRVAAIYVRQSRTSTALRALEDQRRIGRELGVVYELQSLLRLIVICRNAQMMKEAIDYCEQAAESVRQSETSGIILQVICQNDSIFIN